MLRIVLENGEQFFVLRACTLNKLFSSLLQQSTKMKLIYADKNGGKSNRVTFVFLGDGIHEAMNLTDLFDLPVINICENNG